MPAARAQLGALGGTWAALGGAGRGESGPPLGSQVGRPSAHIPGTRPALCLQTPRPGQGALCLQCAHLIPAAGLALGFPSPLHREC